MDIEAVACVHKLQYIQYILSSTLTLGNALVGIVSPFMIFAVFDVLLAVNMRINYSFFTFMVIRS